jgi:hypothetical protein
MTENDMRSFVIEMIEITRGNAPILVNVGYDPSKKVEELTSQVNTANVAEAEEKKVFALANEAREKANDTLEVAYKNASATVEIFAGLLGKDNKLVKELRKLRKVHYTSKKEETTEASQN